MVSKWGWQLLQLSRKLWVRTVAFAVLALLSAVFAVLLQDLIPASVAGIIGAGAAEKILTILASSMLAVTTFSLSIMIAAFSASTNSVSPRATRLLMEDSTTHNALATFVGSFLFSIVSIILLNTKLYNERGEVVLFITTIVVTALIVFTILVWINHLSGLGRVGETANRVEDKAYAALQAFVKQPWHGANPLASLREVPERAKAFLTQAIGYIQHVDVKAINNWAQANDCRVFIVVRAGVFIDPGRPLMWIDGELPDNTDSLIKAFSIDDFRNFDQDPRFGLLVLAEIASKALSPAVNDPGTAIEIIGRGMRVLSNWQLKSSSEAEVRFANVWQLGLDLSDLFDDFFTPIARDGAALVEIHIRLQKSFIALAKVNTQLRIQARRHSEAALARAQQVQADTNDLARLKALHSQLMDT
ncbi:DUF2254 domain-containing protein [Rheinheimera maricola]|uniref:DUF2254 domain-containing protein n=1 Tax=Rheinheimera maricola TaxID=2793282 RepID=A0ABS7X4H8_9GAMM|nr:DUF2254 domain-containing protein [Rheinheimera maricola]MBZ9610447.1 DUF2254 domain-containing protein [Rheinheimera maricola]